MGQAARPQEAGRAGMAREKAKEAKVVRIAKVLTPSEVELSGYKSIPRDVALRI